MKTINYLNTFIEVAPDCPVDAAEIPPERANKTAVRIQYEMLADNPYVYNSDDVIFNVYATKNQIPQEQKSEERNKFFSKGRPCLRSSALGQRYGWGIHSNASGKVAIYAVESDEYKRLIDDDNLKHLQAMRSRRG